MKTIQITIIRPGGNDTALIAGIPATKTKRKEINDAVMKQFPNVEQVGFYQLGTSPRLEMAGGEFCGNALRSFAYICLNGKKGSVRIRMSGTKTLLQAGIYKTNTAFAQIPFIDTQKENSIIELEGITQVITNEDKVYTPFFLKKKAINILKEKNLLQTRSAAGVMFVTEQKGKIILNPVVWVRDIKTLFYETACASGTAAVGIYKALQSSDISQTFSVKQPSGELIQVRIEKNKTKINRVEINGPIKMLWKGEIII